MVNYSYLEERMIAMRYLTIVSDKLMLPKKEAAVPDQGTTASFFSTKCDPKGQWAKELSVSKSVASSLSLPIKDNFFSNLVKRPFAFVVIVEANKGPSIANVKIPGRRAIQKPPPFKAQAGSACIRAGILHGLLSTILKIAIDKSEEIGGIEPKRFNALCFISKTRSPVGRIAGYITI